MTDKLELTRAEVEAVQNYIWIHVRATNGLAKKVWDKMHDYLEKDEKEEQQPTLF